MPTDRTADERGAGAPDIVVEARPAKVAGDPLQGINRQSFAVSQKVDDAVVGPVALGYERAVPGPVRSGVANFLNNTREPVVFLSYLLELKPGKAGETFARFAVNSTVGVAGLFDVAKRKPFHLPRRPNGFADALGYYGVKPGAFLFLPLVGPTTVRDMLGGAADRLVLPMAFGFPFNQFAYSAGTGALSALDRRIAFDDRLRAVRAAGNPYAARRALYLQVRAAEIQRLHSPQQSSRRTGDVTPRVTGTTLGSVAARQATPPPTQ